MPKRRSEEDLAKSLIKWLNFEHWEVYQEVSMGFGMPVADIVAIRGNVTWVIETKLTLSLALIEQAEYYRFRSNYISIAVPTFSTRIKGHKIANHILNILGIGKLSIKPNNEIIVEIQPKLNRIKKNFTIANYLVEAQKTYASAGNSKGQYWTPFKQTEMNLIDFLKKHPNSTLLDVMNNIEHHYSSDNSAKSAIVKWIDSGIIKNVKINRTGKRITLSYIG